MNASSYRGGAILFLCLFSISFVPFPFHYNECFFVHQFGKGGKLYAEPEAETAESAENAESAETVESDGAENAAESEAAGE